MLRCVAVLCALLVCARGNQFHEYNLTVSHLHNTSDHSLVQVCLDHGHNQPLDMFVSETSVSTLVKISRADSETNKSSNAEMKCRDSQLPTPSDNEYKSPPGLGHYKLYNKGISWKEAVETCKKEGTHLLILNSELEAKAVNAIIMKGENPSLGHWVAIHDEYKTGDYVTIYNESLVSTGYSTWQKGYPSRKTTSCLWFWYDKLKDIHGYVDGNCTNYQPFLCELEVS